MSFNYNAGDTKPSAGGGSDPVPAGSYRLRITDAQPKKSKNGDPQVVVTFRVVGGQYDNRRIPFHYVTFLPATSDGAGIALHFLKSIGQPYEGKFTVDPEAWKGKILVGDVIEDQYQGRLQNKVASVDADTANLKADEVLEETPF